MIAVAAPTRVRARLAATSRAVGFLHRGPVAVHLEVDGWCIGVIGTDAAAVPCALRLATPGIGELARASTAHVTDGVLHLDGEPLVVGRTIDVAVPRIGSTFRQALSGAGHLEADLDEVRNELPAPALELLAAGDPAAARHLIGRGSGLTPAGDDVLCGWLATHHAAGVGVPGMERAVSASLSRTTTLSATLLDCALHGEVLPEFSRVVRAVGSSDLRGAVAALARIGHTSGRAMLLGADLAGLALSSLGSERSRCA